MTQRIIAFVLSLTIAAFAQVKPQEHAPIPINTIDIDAARNQLSKLSAADRAIACDDPSLSQHADALIYCRLVANLLDPTAAAGYFAIYATKDTSLVGSFISGIADSNLGTHLGSNPSAPGTASVVERAGYSDVLGLAVESGAVTQSVSGSTITLQSNALSLSRFLSNQDVFQYCAGGTMSCQGSLAPFLNRFSGSAALSVSNTTTQNVTGTVTGSASTPAAPTSATALIQNSATHLTSATVHFQLWNRLDLRDKSYIDAWKKAIGGSGVLAAAKTLEQSTKAFDWFDLSKTEYRNWLRDAEKTVRSKIESEKDDGPVSEAIAEQWGTLLGLAQADKAYNAAAVKQYLQNATDYMAARDIAVNAARQLTQSGMSLEYTYSRPVNQPRISTLRLAFTLHPGTAAPIRRRPPLRQHPARPLTSLRKPETISHSPSTPSPISMIAPRLEPALSVTCREACNTTSTLVTPSLLWRVTTNTRSRPRR